MNLDHLSAPSEPARSRSLASLESQHALLANIEKTQEAATLALPAAAAIAATAWAIRKLSDGPGAGAGTSSPFARIADSTREIYTSIRGIQQELWTSTSLVRQFKEAYLNSFPPNLRHIRDISVRGVLDFLAAEGISLYQVPCQDTAEALLAAHQDGTTRMLLTKKWRPIIADCRAALVRHKNPATAEWSHLVAEGISTYEDGHPSAAQALFIVVIDSITFALPRSDRQRYTGSKNRSTYEVILEDEEYLATALIAIPVWKIHEPNWEYRGDKIPRTLSRHASLHRASSRQYSKRNAIQALLLATSMVCWYSEYGSLHQP
ncbi:MAG: hypothetical protein QM695_02130 [Micropruina sp.]